MQKVYSGWELKACSSSHGSFPANVFCWGGFIRRCCDTRVLSLACSGNSCSFQGELLGAGHRWSLWQEKGMDYARAQPPAPGGCPGAPAQAAIPPEGHWGDVPAPCAHLCREQRLCEGQVWGSGDCRQCVCSPVLRVLRFVCGERALISTHDYLNISTLRILSVF